LDNILGFDIPAALIPDVSLFETIVRGIVMYLAIFVLLRVILRGRTSAVTISDLLVLVLIADAAQNAMADGYASVTNGAVLVGTILFWSYALDWLGYHVPRVRRLVRPRPVPLIVDGRPLAANLRRQLITEEELLSQVRLQGVADVARVQAAYVEVDGRVSVITGEGPIQGARVRPAV
jgi:uncharacterized membrane protein YcaP (DUF421 family)